MLAPTVAYLVTSQQPDRYVATAKLLLRSGELEEGVARVRPGSPVGTQGLEPTSLDLVSLREIGERAARLLDGGITGATVTSRVIIAPNSESNVIGVQASGTKPSGVAPLANAYAEAYISFRRDEARERIGRSKRESGEHEQHEGRDAGHGSIVAASSRRWTAGRVR